MRLLGIVAAAVAFACLGQARAAETQPTSKYPIGAVICHPLPSAPTVEGAEEEKQRLENLAVCPSGQYPGMAEHPVADVRCQPLPPSGSAEAAALFAERLQDLRVCPAGQFPRRYSDGNDLGEGERCVQLKKPPIVRTWKGVPPITNLEVANSDAEMFSRVGPCPYGWDWYAAPPKGRMSPDPLPPLPDSAKVNGRDHSSYRIPQTAARVANMADEPEMAPAACTPPNSNNANDSAFRCYVRASISSG